MKKTPKNDGKPWTPEAVRQVEKLAEENTPTGLIAMKTGRSEVAIRSIAARKGIYLRPTNQSPYNRRKKP
jgi:hypothetical protein